MHPTDCRVCHTWFRSSSQTVQPGKINRTTSPRSAVERAIASNQLNTSEKIKQHYTEIKHHSDTSDCYKETWRVSNPKGEKIIISDSSPRALKNKKSVEKCEKNDSNNSSPLTTTAVSSDFVGVTRPLAQRPYLFY